MPIVIGVDPGVSGAFAAYDTETKRIIDVHDMPVWHQTVGKTKRARVDALAVAELFDYFVMIGAELVIIESVGGRPGQGASAGFSFGYGVGIIAMAAVMSKLIIETTPPSVWKKLLNVPGKSKAGEEDIIHRAIELMPQDRSMFLSAKHKPMIDRIEAAMLAKFGGDYVLKSLGYAKGDSTEFDLAYRK